MEKYQESVYNHFEEIEEEREKLNRKLSRGRVGEEISTYNALCLPFVLNGPQITLFTSRLKMVGYT